jgi:hypothetical protein
MRCPLLVAWYILVLSLIADPQKMRISMGHLVQHARLLYHAIYGGVPVEVSSFCDFV